MGSDLLGVGVTGLKVSQQALSTTGHNISNAGTEGFSRQTVSPVSNAARLNAGQFIGSGANVNAIERIANDFITKQLRTDASLSSNLTAFHEQVSQLDNLLSEGSTGLTGGMQSFFAAMQNGADDPTSIPARQLVVSEAQNLADRFNSIDARLKVIEEGVKDGMQVAVSKINTLVENVTQLNLRIADAYGLSATATPNDLLDQRDEALRQLAELVPIQTFDQGNSQTNVLIAGGLPLIVGSESYSISLQTGRSAGNDLDLILLDGGEGRVMTDQVTGGELGALVRFRDEELNPAFNSLGRIAIVLADEFNQIHQQGITPDNNFGGLFFNDMNDENIARQRVIATKGNALPADRQMAVYINDSSQLSLSDYTVSIGNNGLYRIERLSDSTEVTTGLLPSSFPVVVEFDGLKLEFIDGSFSAGDEFKLKPLANGAHDFERVVQNPSDIAFGSPLLSDAEIGNTGSASVSAGKVLALTNKSGDALPLFAETGTMSPPMVIQFTSAQTYDVLDNTDPANPKQLDPPIRNQRFIPGVNNSVFPTLDGQTQLSMEGIMTGLPEGKSAITQAFINPPTVNPADAITGLSAPYFTVTDFSGAEQFSFDVELSDTVLGVKDSLTTVTINSPNITTEAELLQHINSQLGPTGVRAFMAVDAAGNRSVAFKAADGGYGNVSVHSYAGAATGNANGLLNIDIEAGGLWTSAAGANGVEGIGVLSNGYPAQTLVITKAPSQAGLVPITYSINTDLNASAREIANELSNVQGVEANAFTYAEINRFDVTRTEPLQVTLNGLDLVEYKDDGITGSRTMVQSVPDPSSDAVSFNQYLASRINDNSDFKKEGIYAVAGQDPITGEPELRVYSSAGDDLTFGLVAAAGETLQVSDGEHNPLSLAGAGNYVASQVVVGGQLDVRLTEGLTLATRPADSLLFGDTSAQNFVSETFLGIEVSLSGVPDSGDRFTLDFNTDAVSDNRTALAFVGIESERILSSGSASLTDAYGTLVEAVGISTSAAKTNADAASAVLEQTQALRNSISGVNLDEEAANLIRFEQFFQANAQVISVARELFDTLLGSF
ncbi:flagellar hook-associated protein FlgK [Marinagarivorans algicola]|uniref:flagellar hook-associated protein FlgK n=1 Tax=Marinagarivorans algicola TaxID=1513270 RepID=UPI0006B47862|nr:flagellar hook-associated protein FlgK [Marinagarivorans algicola]